MTARHVASAQPIIHSAPVAIEAELRLELMPGQDNPLPSGGTLLALGVGASIEPSSTGHTTGLLAFAPECPSMLSLELQSGGHRLLALDLEINELGDDPSDRIELDVTSRGILPEHAACLGAATGTYAWRLSGLAMRSDQRLQLSFKLAQELAPQAPVPALTSVHLPFDAAEGDEPKQARIKIKPSGTGIQVPTA
jgi:hypothetical protein